MSTESNTNQPEKWHFTAPHEIDLKPCPFCGPGQSIVTLYQDDFNYWVVGCGRCGSHSGIRPVSDPDGRNRVISLWNTRPMETSSHGPNL